MPGAVNDEALALPVWRHPGEIVARRWDLYFLQGDYVRAVPAKMANPAGAAGSTGYVWKRLEVREW